MPASSMPTCVHCGLGVDSTRLERVSPYGGPFLGICPDCRAFVPRADVRHLVEHRLRQPDMLKKARELGRPEPGAIEADAPEPRREASEQSAAMLRRKYG